MTASETRTTEAPPERSLAGEVGRRIAALQRGVLDNQSSARATAAQLRKAITRPAGSDPAIWSVTALYDDPRGLPDEPTREETAAHLALCMWAIHQQSRPTAMHVPDRPFARAVAELARRRGTDETDPVRRRFDAVATAADLSETVHHLRGLVTQLRAEGLSIDYGRLAEDLVHLGHPGVRSNVLRRWGREYHARPADDTTTSPATNPTTQEN